MEGSSPNKKALLTGARLLPPAEPTPPKGLDNENPVSGDFTGKKRKACGLGFAGWVCLP